MTTEERLREALEWRAGTATRGAGALEEIRRRSGRRRWTARLQVAGAAVATAGVVVGVAALATPRGTDPAPPVTTTGPTTGPTAGPTTAAPSASASPSPASGARVAAGPDEYAALLDDGRLVLASATDGRIVHTVTTLTLPEPAYFADVALTPDRTGVYVTTDPCKPMQHFVFATGTRTALKSGFRADPHPDGHRVAYATQCDGPPAAAVVDRRTGKVEDFPYLMGASSSLYPPAWNVDRVRWHADGKRLWVVLAWEGETSLRLLDPAEHRSINEAPEAKTKFTANELDRRGDGLVYLHRCCYPEDSEPASIVVRDAAGRERAVVTAPASGKLGGPRAGPDGDLLYTQSGTLFRLDLDTGETTALGRSTALARDW